MNKVIAEQEFEAEVHTAVMKALSEPEAFHVDRSRIGDVAFGAHAAGADVETSIGVATTVHSAPELRSRILHEGGLRVGASFHLLRGEIDG